MGNYCNVIDSFHVKDVAMPLPVGDVLDLITDPYLQILLLL